MVLKSKKDKKPFYDWVGVKEKYPPEFELVSILFEDDYKQPGWWTGQVWDSGHKLCDKKIIAWRRIMTHAAV